MAIINLTEDEEFQLYGGQACSTEITGGIHSRVSVKRRPDGGGWRMADGGWRMADGGWRTADDKIGIIKCGWKNADNKMQMTKKLK